MRGSQSAISDYDYLDGMLSPQVWDRYQMDFDLESGLRRRDARYSCHHWWNRPGIGSALGDVRDHCSAQARHPAGPHNALLLSLNLETLGQNGQSQKRQEET